MTEDMTVLAGIKELIDNALDAGATRVGLTLDMDARTLEILDDGEGLDEDGLRKYKELECESSPD